MAPKFYEVDQRTGTWFEMRRGLPTASNFNKIFTPGGEPSGKFNKASGRIAWSDQAKNYMYRLVAERVLQETFQHEEDDVRGRWVEHGIECEPKALALFSETHRLILRRVGFVTTEDGMLGCSPDALVEGSVEAVEVKCKAPWNQMRYLLEGPGRDYKPQVQGLMLVGEWDIVHFFAYHPQMPAFHTKTERDDHYIENMHDVLYAFCCDLDRAEQRARACGEYWPLAVEETGLDWFQQP